MVTGGPSMWPPGDLACSGAVSRSQARAAAAWSLVPALASCAGDSGMSSIATSSTTAGKQQT